MNLRGGKAQLARKADISGHEQTVQTMWERRRPTSLWDSPDNYKQGSAFTALIEQMELHLTYEGPILT
jgi:hypothetical protein